MTSLHAFPMNLLSALSTRTDIALNYASPPSELNAAFCKILTSFNVSDPLSIACLTHLPEEEVNSEQFWQNTIKICFKSTPNKHRRWILLALSLSKNLDMIIDESPFEPFPDQEHIAFYQEMDFTLRERSGIKCIRSHYSNFSITQTFQAPGTDITQNIQMSYNHLLDGPLALTLDDINLPHPNFDLEETPYGGAPYFFGSEDQNDLYEEVNDIIENIHFLTINKTLRSVEFPPWKFLFQTIFTFPFLLTVNASVYTVTDPTILTSRTNFQHQCTEIRAFAILKEIFCNLLADTFASKIEWLQACLLALHQRRQQIETTQSNEPINKEEGYPLAAIAIDWNKMTTSPPCSPEEETRWEIAAIDSAADLLTKIIEKKEIPGFHDALWNSTLHLQANNKKP